MVACSARLPEKVALSCRILAMSGLADGTTGHVSARIAGSEAMFLRCRTDEEQGIAYTTEEAIKRVDYDGKLLDPAERCEVPNEHPIHGEVYKKHAAVGCVVHVHPPALVKCSIADIAIRPIWGAYDPDTLRLTMDGVPVYPRSITLTDRKWTNDMLQAMGERAVCVLKGHGAVIVGRTVEEATVRAIRLESIAQLCWDMAASQLQVSQISDEDMQYFKALFRRRAEKVDTGAPSHSDWLWRYYVKKLECVERGVHR